MIGNHTYNAQYDVLAQHSSIIWLHNKSSVVDYHEDNLSIFIYTPIQRRIGIGCDVMSTYCSKENNNHNHRAIIVITISNAVTQINAMQCNNNNNNK